MGAIEALLFVSDEPVGTHRLAEILEVSPAEVDEALALLSAEYVDENRGMQLREVAGGWRFYTHPAFHGIIERYVISWDTHRMSQAALEALAVIAYHQPVTRASVNAIRGVNSESVVSSLVEKGLVREMGRDKPGGAILYGTTRAFLERFGLKSVKDLPPLEDFAPDEESREQIRERLSGAGKMPDMQLELAEDGEGIAAVPELRIVEEDGTPRVEEVDSGDEERVDDAQGMSEVIGQAMTEKVEFDIFEFDDEDDEEEASGQDVEEDEDDVYDEADEEEDDLIDYADDEADDVYRYEEDPEDDDDEEPDDAPDEDDEIEIVE